MTNKAPEETCILVVDDDNDFRNALSFFFKRKGYQVLSASNGNDAFELIRTQPVDAVISDIQMPGGNGIEFLDRAKEHNIQTPIVLLITGFADITTEDAHHKGAEALFSKPFKQKVLEDAIARLLTPLEKRWAVNAEKPNAEINVELQFEKITQAIQAKVISLGRGGMFVSIQDRNFPNINETVNFKIAFEGKGASMQGTGIVRWVRIKNTPQSQSGCGIEFTYLGEKEREQVIEYVNAKKPKAYIPNQ